MYCSHCGKEIEDNAVFCTNCGAKIDHVNPESDQKKPDVPVAEQAAKEPPKVTVDLEKTISIAQMYGFEDQKPKHEPKADVVNDETKHTASVDPYPQPISQQQSPGQQTVPQYQTAQTTQTGQEPPHRTAQTGQEPPHQTAQTTQEPPHQTAQTAQEPPHQTAQTAQDPPHQSVQNGYNTSYGNAYNSSKSPVKSVSFGEAIRLFFENYVNFTGRASRSEYWWGFLFTFLMSFTIVGGIACYIGMLSLTIRRIHDIGKRWFWILMGLIPFAGLIILIVSYCKDSVGDNQWGPGPKPF